MALTLVLTCEHAGNRVPREYAKLFGSRTARTQLASHRGFDPGALRVARAARDALEVPLLYTEVTRLLVEANRSLHHPRLFSSFTSALNADERAEIIDRYYHP